VDLIRGRKADEAMDILKYTHKRAANFVMKVLKSAVANADEKEADVERLYVAEARVDEGPRMKRVSPKDRGRAYTIVKQMSHIKITVEER
jgi:large subunit ribosomal protein L22